SGSNPPWRSTLFGVPKAQRLQADTSPRALQDLRARPPLPHPMPPHLGGFSTDICKNFPNQKSLRNFRKDFHPKTSLFRLFSG
ncbi:MAG: hypothetical protein VX228_15115, partial [Pseudomonadota bacterium]|nr:hypothetical protein [Pseudomonadota bacterium]